MAHYAFLNQDNIVTEVIVGKNEGEDMVDWEARYALIRGQRCLRTSFNTYGGHHRFGGTPFRKNYAGIGYQYNEALDAFVPPKPFPSWILNQDTCLWEAPTPQPSDVGPTYWDENTKQWVQLEADNS